MDRACPGVFCDEAITFQGLDHVLNRGRRLYRNFERILTKTVENADFENADLSINNDPIRVFWLRRRGRRATPLHGAGSSGADDADPDARNGEDPFAAVFVVHPYRISAQGECVSGEPFLFERLFTDLTAFRLASAFGRASISEEDT